MTDSYSSRTRLDSGGRTYEYYALPALEDQYRVSRLPYSMRILLENLLRLEDGSAVTRDDIDAVARWDASAEPAREISFTPSRVLLQDFTGVPALVDLAAMRDAMKAMGGDPAKINPLQPADLVIDHSVQVDRFASRFALDFNIEREYERNTERYQFLKWGQQAFDNFTVVPPGTGIVHQINLEYIARVAFVAEGAGSDGLDLVYPDTLVGTDSHTTMINGLGVLGWGVGGIEAEAAMLGQPISMLLPQVVGFRLTGSLPEAATATDLVLTVTEMLRLKGVVGKFVEFFGPGLSNLPLADRATLGNMSPEFGSTCAIFPVDEETLNYLRLTGRSEDQVRLVEDYYRAQGLFRTDADADPEYTDTLELDLGDVVPSIAGPRRPQDRVALSDVKTQLPAWLDELERPHVEHVSRDLLRYRWEGGGEPDPESGLHLQALEGVELNDGAVVIAAITSCTNTSNPSVMVAAGLVARRARELGLSRKPWVKTSLAPGSKVVTRYLDESGLSDDLEDLGFHTVGYGCTTCIGNSGPLPDEIREQVLARNLSVASVLSGNRNFEGRISGDVKMNFLASPPLVVAYSIAGHMSWDPDSEPLGTDRDGNDVYLRDVWPSQQEISDVIASSVKGEMFGETYREVYDGDEHWRALDSPEGDIFDWQDDSTYIKHPPYFTDLSMSPEALHDIRGARCLVVVGDSVTTDHISPAGAIAAGTPAAEYLSERGVERRQFNSYGSRRGNHEVMMRGTFANVRLRNRLAPGTEGGWTTYPPGEKQMSIFDAAERYRAEGVPTIVLAGKEYGSGSSRDWAAKGPRLLGVAAVIAESYERIHRSNLIGMGVLPLQFSAGHSAEALGLDGTEHFDIVGVGEVVDDLASRRSVEVVARTASGDEKARFDAIVRLDTPNEAEYYRHGGILQYVLRGLLEPAHA